MKVTAIMATCGRHHLCERSLRFFLDQDYEGDHKLLIFNNSPWSQSLLEKDNKEIFGLKGVKLINCGYDFSEVGVQKPYSNLGQIYRDALKHVDEDTDVIVHWDDDDLFLPNHISEGVRGLTRGHYRSDMVCRAYKPAKSYYRHPGGIQLMSNTLEPSIFVDADHIREYGYSETTTDQHLQWVNPLVYGRQIFVDEAGPATLIYNWGDTDIPTFKTSGNAGDPRNFDNYRNFSSDHGDKIISPWTKEEVQQYYDLVNYGNV